MSDLSAREYPWHVGKKKARYLVSNSETMKKLRDKVKASSSKSWKALSLKKRIFKEGLNIEYYQQKLGEIENLGENKWA